MLSHNKYTLRHILKQIFEQFSRQRVLGYALYKSFMKKTLYLTLEQINYLNIIMKKVFTSIIFIGIEFICTANKYGSESS